MCRAVLTTNRLKSTPMPAAASSAGRLTDTSGRVAEGGPGGEYFVGDQLQRLRIERDNLRSRQVDRERARGGRHGPTVYCTEQCGQVRCEEVGDVLVDRLVGIERDALAHRVLDPGVVAAAL